MVKKINISEDKCIQCNLCVEVCPKLIFVKNNKNTPLVENEEKCIECGQCLAVCPTNAIIYPELKKAEVTDESVKQEIDLKLFLGSLRSVRKYKNLSVEEKVIDELIKIAALAPSASNSRKNSVLVITNSEKISLLEKLVIEHFKSLVKLFSPFLQQVLKIFSPSLFSYVNKLIPSLNDLIKRHLDERHPIFYKAPAVVCFIGPKVNRMSKDDADAHMHYFRIAAHVKGLASCIIGYAMNAHKEIEKELKIDKRYQIYAVLTIGYPQINYSKIIERKLPKH